MAFSMAGRGPSGPQINLTPRVDVLLTRIITFRWCRWIRSTVKGANSAAES